MERSRTEVERTLMRYGATGFAYAWERREQANPNAGKYGQPKTLTREVVAIHFKFKERAIQLEVPMPHELEAGTKAKADAATRQRWRALVLVIKAKLEAVASGISTLEQEFLANVVMANGQTIGQAILPRLSEAVSSGRLLGPAGGDR
jgi:hypothetical protein